MSNFNEAADAIRRVSKLLDGFRVVADALESVASIDQAATEAKLACDKAKKDRDAALADVNEAKKQLADIRAKAKQLATDAKTVADKTVADALENAKIVFSEKEAAHVGKITALAKSANAERDAAIAEAKKQAAVNAALVKIGDDLDVQIEAKSAHLESLNAALETLKAKLA